jgi:hypothetical protein
MSICNRTQQECRDPQACLANGCAGQRSCGLTVGCGKHWQHEGPCDTAIFDGMVSASRPPQQPDRLREGANAIRARIKELRATHATELEYVQHRLRERDWHGLWDGAIGAAEWEIEITALEWCLGQFGQEV